MSPEAQDGTAPELPLKSLHSATATPKGLRMGAWALHSVRAAMCGLALVNVLHFLATSAAAATGQQTGRPVQPGGWILGVEVTELWERDVVRAV